MKVEIKKDEEEEVIDFSKPQLLISKITNDIVWCDGNKDELFFSGYKLTSNNRVTYGDAWTKHKFKVFKGELVLSND